MYVAAVNSRQLSAQRRWDQFDFTEVSCVNWQPTHMSLQDLSWGLVRDKHVGEAHFQSNMIIFLTCAIFLDSLAKIRNYNTSCELLGLYSCISFRQWWKDTVQFELKAVNACGNKWNIKSLEIKMHSLPDGYCICNCSAASKCTLQKLHKKSFTGTNSLIYNYHIQTHFKNPIPTTETTRQAVTLLQILRRWGV